MKKLILFVCATCLFLFGCPADPDETGIPNGQDFKDFTVLLVGSTVITDIYFYGNLELREFFYYYEKGNDNPAPKNQHASTQTPTPARFLIRCNSKIFKIYKESELGEFIDLRYSETPTVNNDEYHLEFPLSALELDNLHEFAIYYWFFIPGSGDRMPDSGRELLSNAL